MRTILLASLLSIMPLLAANVHASADGDPFLFVTFELGELVAKTPFSGTFHASFGDSSADAQLSATNREAIQGSISIPTNLSSGPWTVNVSSSGSGAVLTINGVLTADGIQILGSRVNSDAIDLPRDTTSLRIVKGYVSATVTLIGRLVTPDCCTATLGIDANADGNISVDETIQTTAHGKDVNATIFLEKAAPSVPYVFTIASQGKTVARASGTYSFTNLNGVSTTGEFDPAFVEYVSGRVERVPHLVQHDIGSGVLLQTVTGMAQETEGPRVFFTMGTPASSQQPTNAPQAVAVTSPTEPGFLARVGAVLTAPVVIGIALGSFIAAALALMVRRMMARWE